MTVNAVETIVFDDFTKGMNNWDQPHRLEPGFYVYGLNTYLTRRHPTSRTGQTLLNTNTPSNGTIIWAEPYTDKDGVSSILVATADNSNQNTFASFYKYVAGTDTWTHLFTSPTLAWGNTAVGSFGTNISSVVADKTLIVCPAGAPLNRGVYPWKYDGTNLLVLGSMLVADFESNWTTVAGNVSYNTTQYVYKTRSLKIETGGSARLDFSSLNLLDGPGSISSDMWSSSLTPLTTAARLCGYLYKHQIGNLTIAIEFHNAASVGVNYTTFTFASDTGATAGWGSFAVLRSAGVATGTGADWSNVGRVVITVSGGAAGEAVSFDLLRWAHSDALHPRAGHVIEIYKEQLIIGNYNDISSNAPDDTTSAYIHRNSIARSPVGEYDVHDDSSEFAGGRSLLEGVDHITALRTYFDLLIVGKPTSTWAFSGTGSNVAINAQQTTVGVDSHRVVVEVPWSVLLTFEYNVYANRLTNRSILSLPVREQMEDIGYSSSSLARAVATRWDRGRQVKFAWLKSTTAVTAAPDNILYYDYQLNAWTGQGSSATDKESVAHWCRYIDSNGVRRLLVIDGENNYLKIEDSGGAYFQPSNTPIPAMVVMPYFSAKGDPATNKTMWTGLWFGLKQNASTVTTVQARFADWIEDFLDGDSTTGFTTYETLTGNDHAGMNYVQIGVRARYMQVKFNTASSLGDWAIIPPVVVEYIPSKQRA